MQDDILQYTFDNNMIRVMTDENDWFELSSGTHSPLYIDGRKAMGNYESRKAFGAAMADTVKETDISYDIIAGGATGGISYGLEAADALAADFAYVRKETKDYGTGERIECQDDIEDQRVLIIEDLATTGGSMTSFIKGVRDADGIVDDCLVFYDREQGAAEQVKAHGGTLHSVVTADELLQYGLEHDEFTPEETETVESWLNNQ